MSFGHSRYIFNEYSQQKNILEQSQNVHQCLCAIQQSINGSKELHKRLVGLAFWHLCREKNVGETMYLECMRNFSLIKRKTFSNSLQIENRKTNINLPFITSGRLSDFVLFYV